MRRYVIDDMTAEDVTRLEEGLRGLGLAASVQGLYWLPVPEAMLTTTQKNHLASCGPYVMALEITADGCSLEFLVRARNRLRCHCVGMASPEVMAGMAASLEALLGRLGVRC